MDCLVPQERHLLYTKKSNEAGGQALLDSVENSMYFIIFCIFGIFSFYESGESGLKPLNMRIMKLLPSSKQLDHQPLPLNNMSENSYIHKLFRLKT